MGWSRKHNKHSTRLNSNFIADKAAHKIVRLFDRLQNAFANKMNKVFSKMERKSLKRLLVLFCLAWGGLSLYFVIHSLATTQQTSVVKIDRMNMPTHFDETGDAETRTDEAIDDATYQKIMVFEIYMDSLNVNAKVQYDSIMAARPQLMDSIAWLKQLYFLQQNTSNEK